MRIKLKTLFVLSILSCGLFAQAPIVYINFVSHNEPNDDLNTFVNFNSTKLKVLQLADIMNMKGAAWNLQTCDEFAKGALDIQGATSNIFRDLATSPYDDNIEIDPRNKMSVYTNIADLYHVLDSLGANPTTTLGGFLYSPSPDWFKYQKPVNSVSFPGVSWNCNLMWGAGSPGHSNDYNDYGIWKPDSVTASTFITHNDGRNIWYVGNGCQPIYALDSTENIADILTPLKAFIDSLQTSKLPQEKFYCYSITINQSHFGPTLFSKVSTICDTINAWGSDKIQWATLTDKLNIFENWQSNPSQYSQWKCGEMSTGLIEKKNIDFSIFPNPSQGIIELNTNDNQEHNIIIYSALGKEIMTTIFINNEVIDLSEAPSGIYIGTLDNEKTFKIVKQ